MSGEAEEAGLPHAIPARCVAATSSRGVRRWGDIPLRSSPRISEDKDAGWLSKIWAGPKVKARMM